jgi:ABC-type nickel/cobalt efflux system permease component RcnA
MCAVSVPKVSVYTTIYAKKQSTTFDITWKFHPEFNEALQPYDMNENGMFEKQERDALLEAINVYIEPIHYLTNIEYLPKDTDFQQYYIEPIKTNFEKVTFDKEGSMLYNYNFDLDLVLKKDHKLSLSFFDGGGNFDFILKDVILKDYMEFKAIVPRFQESYIYFFEKYQNQNELHMEQEFIPAILQTQENDINESSADEKRSQQKLPKLSPLELLSEKLNEIKVQIEDTLQDIKQNNSLSAYFWLLFFSFIYGILHAIGPGHGKSLVSSYFINQNKSYLKAFSISSLIGVVHTFSAFVLTLIVYFILGLMFSSSLVNIEQMATKVSAMIIIAIALYLIYKKIKKAKNKITFAPAQQFSFIKPQSNLHKPIASCECSGCQTTSTDLGVILAAGIVPCPGTVTIFLFTISLGIYFVGFLSAVFMSIGMSLVIYITALLSLKVRKSTSSNTAVVKFLEYGSLCFILFLGIILLII